jgi:hypothetical protein
MSTKTCNHCKIEKPLACFSKNKANKDGIHNRCRICDSEAGKKWKEKNYAKKYAYDKQFYHAQKEKYDAMVVDNHFSIDPAVYMIKNMVNGKCYIGTSKAPYRRAKQHLSYHEEGVKLCTPEILADEVAFYGKKSFIWGVIEYVSKEDKFIKEREYISIYQPEYNNRK